ncbi:MFS transporter, partial [Nonomuraea sp. NPDC049784]|uniref:MFS transporter n=1 Tax=Nonomuraea sp. NPDC049784 TaxID=3154361 RepID=UPI0033D60BE6
MRPAPGTRQGVLRRERTAVYLLFFLAGTAMGTWTARIPAIKEHLELGDGQFSLALLAIAGGAMAGMTAVGRLVDRHGSSRVMIPAALLQGVVLVPPTYAPSLWALAGTLLAFGIVHGILDVAMNANAVEVERAYGRPIMSSFHAVYSIGGFTGATAGGLFAHLGLSAAATFLSMGTVIALLAIWAARWALRSVPPSAQDPASGSGSGSGGSDARPKGIVFLGVLAFCCLVGEGASADWSSVYLREDLAASPGFAAAGYAAFSIMMTAGRLAGD